MSFSMVGKTWSHVSYCWLFGLSNPWDYLGHKLRLEGFFLANILTNLKKYHLQSNNLERLIFVSTNWQNDPKIDCKPPSFLVELVESNLNFEEFEGSLNKMNLWTYKCWHNLLNFMFILCLFYNFIILK